MAVTLNSDQVRAVTVKRLKPELRPKYFNAVVGEYKRISEDFESFLILQGRARNKEAVDWLQKASSYAVNDTDRDSLLNALAENEMEDAAATKKETDPITEQFNKFRDRYSHTGFENVTEAGQLLADLQQPMFEIITLGNRQLHRQIFAKLTIDKLIKGGITSNQAKQLNSWFEPLTTY